ncbi:helix-turn-helix domain-containing protein [Roseateles chitinivorans]|uniref:helix-turn-helix domain-containing protein n=1 Tax=Roseateles chitinivorans TaxID=2917965 RepID=UPI003D679A85
MEFLKAFGQVFRAAREHASLTQAQLGLQAGVHPNTVGFLERGEVGVSLDVLNTLCREMGFKPWELLLETEYLLDGKWGLIGSETPLVE